VGSLAAIWQQFYSVTAALGGNGVLSVTVAPFLAAFPAFAGAGTLSATASVSLPGTLYDVAITRASTI